MATKRPSGSSRRSERKADDGARSRTSPAARGATSAKGTMSGPGGKSKLSPHRGLIERAATAPGRGGRDHTALGTLYAIAEQMFRIAQR